MNIRISPLHPEFQQEAVARGFEREYEVFETPESYFQQLPAMLHHKKEKLASLLESVGLKPIMPEGGYFITADFSSIGERRTSMSTIRQHGGCKTMIFTSTSCFLTEVDYDDPSCKDEAKDFRFVKWLIKEKVGVLL